MIISDVAVVLIVLLDDTNFMFKPGQVLSKHLGHGGPHLGLDFFTYWS